MTNLRPSHAKPPDVSVVDRDRPGGPMVTPEPAPPDDRLLRLSAGAIAGSVLAALVVWRWARRYVKVSVGRPTR